MGRRIWAVHGGDKTSDGMIIPPHVGGPYRVLSLRRILPAHPHPDAPPNRKKHMVQLWCDPGGFRTLNVGAIQLKDPGRAAAMQARHDRGDFDKEPEPVHDNADYHGFERQEGED